jgi:hypothetical protein
VILSPRTGPATLGRRARLAAAAAVAAAVRRSREHGDRGDVPGWVLVTLMTAGLVTALWAVASDRLVALFEQALSSVTG